MKRASLMKTASAARVTPPHLGKKTKWAPLNISQSELSLALTFPTGQTFRWKQTGHLQYSGTIGPHLISLKHHDNGGDVCFQIHHSPSEAAAKAALLDFLNADISLAQVWEVFSSDSHFAEISKYLAGARVLRQDPLECLLQFLCSSNNNISRITKMVEFISSLGTCLGHVEGFEFHQFPSLESLSSLSEEDLRKAGFGYRAKYITGTVNALQSKPGGGVEWLMSLRKLDLHRAVAALSTLPGVGPKVAACVALFSLDQHQAIPVDTHVWQVATKSLIPELAGESLTPKLHSRVAEAFVSKYGKYAGWVQNLLFVAELPAQKAILPSTFCAIKEVAMMKASIMKTASAARVKPPHLGTKTKWAPLNISQSELSLALTFPTGQTFRWKQTGHLQFSGTIGPHLISLKHHDNGGDVCFQIHHSPSEAAAKAALLDFLNADISLAQVWEVFSSDSHFAEISKYLAGARVLRQDPLECLLQFLCSSNNNISRITKMVEFISSLGTCLGHVEGFEFHQFPSLESLSSLSEEDLRKAGFGYRAKYITGTVNALQSKPGGGVEWLMSLRKLDLHRAVAALSALPGVGPKVAACVALFSLDQHQAVPVDTHVWQVATKSLIPELAGERLTSKLHSRVAEAFVSKYGKYAGWAQNLLFIAELPAQKAILPSSFCAIKVNKSTLSKTVNKSTSLSKKVNKSTKRKDREECKGSS